MDDLSTGVLRYSASRDARVMKTQNYFIPSRKSPCDLYPRFRKWVVEPSRILLLYCVLDPSPFVFTLYCTQQNTIQLSSVDSPVALRCVTSGKREFYRVERILSLACSILHTIWVLARCVNGYDRVEGSTSVSYTGTTVFSRVPGPLLLPFVGFHRQIEFLVLCMRAFGGECGELSQLTSKWSAQSNGSMSCMAFTTFNPLEECVCIVRDLYLLY